MTNCTDYLRVTMDTSIKNGIEKDLQLELWEKYVTDFIWWELQGINEQSDFYSSEVDQMINVTVEGMKGVLKERMIDVNNLTREEKDTVVEKLCAVGFHVLKWRGDDFRLTVELSSPYRYKTDGFSELSDQECLYYPPTDIEY